MRAQVRGIMTAPTEAAMVVGVQAEDILVGVEGGEVMEAGCTAAVE